MEIPLSAILIVLFLGAGLAAPLIYFTKLRHGVFVVMHKRWFSLPVLLLFALLFWPVDPGQAYGGDVGLGLQRLVRIVILGGLFVVLLPRFIKHFPLTKRSVLNWYFLYVVTCFVSAMYAPDWREALWKSIELLVVFMIAAVVRIDVRRRTLTLDDILSVYLLLLFVVIFFALVGWVTFPTYAFDQWAFEESLSQSKSLGGIAPRTNPNSLGQFSGMIFFAGVMYWYLGGKGFHRESALFVLLGGIALVLAHSRTSLASVALLSALVLFIGGRTKGRLLLFIAALLVVTFFPLLFEYYMRGQDIDQFRSLSGRVYMWEIALASIVDNPWFGIGMAGHKKLNIELGMEFSSVDSTYVEALVNVGFVGAIFLIIFILVVLFRVSTVLIHELWSRRTLNLTLVIVCGFAFLMFIRSVTGPSFQALHWNLVMLLTLTAAAFDGKRRT